MSDLKAGVPSDIMATTFMEVSKKCLQRNHKRRCKMSEVCVCSHNNIIQYQYLNMIIIIPNFAQTIGSVYVEFIHSQHQFLTMYEIASLSN